MLVRKEHLDFFLKDGKGDLILPDDDDNDSCEESETDEYERKFILSK